MRNRELIGFRYCSGNAQITPLFVLVIGVFFSLILGFQAATGAYRTLVVWGLVGLGLAYVAALHRYSWFLIVLTLSLGFTMHPLGFAIDERHVAFALCAGIVVLHILSTGGDRMPPAILASGLRSLQIGCAIWLVYLGVHFLYNKTDPYLAGQFSVKNAVKAYFAAAVAPAIILVLSIRTQGIRLPRNWQLLLLVAILIGVALNTAYRFYAISQGISIYGEGRELYYELGAFYVPVIYLTPGLYVLRFLGPLGAGFAALLATDSRWLSGSGICTKALVYATYLLSVVGALASGGRAAILLAGIFTLGVLIYRGRLILVMTGVVATIAFVAAVNIFSATINRSAPYDVARTLQYFMIEKGTAADSIEGSSDYRADLRARAYHDWRKDRRAFWVGRSVFSNQGDIYLLKRIYGGNEGSIQNSLAFGATHTLITDVLLQYGLVGACLYAVFGFLLLRFLARLYFRRKLIEPEVRDLVFLVGMVCGVNFCLAPIAGTWTTVWSAWLVVTAIVAQAKVVPAPSPPGERSNELNQSVGQGPARHGRRRQRLHPVHR